MRSPPRPWPPAGTIAAVSVEHYENFPVASVLCPPALRPAVVAIYHFARTADDIADEGQADTATRLATLRAYRADLQALFENRTPSARWRPVFDALQAARRSHQLPQQPLADLLSAFEQDAPNPVHADRDSLLAYCRLSAAPIGRLLLHLYGVQDALSLRQSDAVCTALQLINFWQDLGVDLPRGRLYLPTQELARHGLAPEDLGRPDAGTRLRPLLAELCAWAESLMLEGAPLARRLPGRMGWELRLVVEGGLRIMEKIRAMDHDTIHRRPVLTWRDAPLLMWRAATRQPGRTAR